MLSPCDRGNIQTKNRKLNPVLNQVRSLRYLQKLSILESVPKLTDEPSFNFILSLGPLIMSVGFLLKHFGGELALIRVLDISIFIDQKIRWLHLILALPLGCSLLIFARSRKFLLQLVIGLHLSDIVHESDTLRQDFHSLTGFGDAREVFIKLIKMLLKVRVLSFFGQVHEQI